LVGGAIATVSLGAGSATSALLAGTVGTLGVGILAVALVAGWPGGIGAAIVLLGLGYLGHVLLGSDVSPALLVSVSVALLLVGELGQWSLDRRVRGTYERGLAVSRGAGIGLLVVLGTGMALLGLVVTGIPVPGGLPAQAAAVAAAVALLTLVASVARRKGGGDDRIRTGE
jgi:hypothetical protein